jgi:hypothetical protein
VHSRCTLPGDTVVDATVDVPVTSVAGARITASATRLASRSCASPGLLIASFVWIEGARSGAKPLESPDDISRIRR